MFRSKSSFKHSLVYQQIAELQMQVAKLRAEKEVAAQKGE